MLFAYLNASFNIIQIHHQLNCPFVGIVVLNGFTEVPYIHIQISFLFNLSNKSIGEMLSSASVGILLAFAGVGGILFPWLVGIVADHAGLRSGMAVNLIPCIGITAISLIMLSRRKGRADNQTTKEGDPV